MTPLADPQPPLAGLGQWAARHRARLLIVALALFAFVFALDGFLHEVGPLPGEQWLADRYDTWKPYYDFPSQVWFGFQFLGYATSDVVAPCLVVAVGLVLADNYGRRWGLLVLVAGAVTGVNELLKHLFGPTPLWREVEGAGLNYPSGHAAFAIAVLGYVALVTWPVRQRAIAIIALLLIVVMALTRVVSGAHMPSDVIAGLALGAAWLAALVALGVPWAARAK